MLAKAYRYIVLMDTGHTKTCTLEFHPTDCSVPKVKYVRVKSSSYRTCVRQYYIALPSQHVHRSKPQGNTTTQSSLSSHYDLDLTQESAFALCSQIASQRQCASSQRDALVRQVWRYHSALACWKDKQSSDAHADS